MTIVGSYLKVQDNSGGKHIKCIRVLNKSRGKIATVGDLLVVTVKSLRRSLPNKDVKIGEITLAVILTTRNPKHRRNGLTLRVHHTSAVLLHRQKKEAIGSRIASGVFNEIRERLLIKLLTLTKGMM